MQTNVEQGILYKQHAAPVFEIIRLIPLGRLLGDCCRNCDKWQWRV